MWFPLFAMGDRKEEGVARQVGEGGSQAFFCGVLANLFVWQFV